MYAFASIWRKISRIRFRRTRYKLRMLWSHIRREPLDTRLRLFFDFWAQNHKGEKMERDHLCLTAKAIERMRLTPGDRVLDLGCGEGLASRLISGQLSGCPHRVLGIDISDEMLRRARTKSNHLPQVDFLSGSAEHIPCEQGAFTKVLSVEAFYYFGNQERVLDELLRVLAPSGWLFLVICHYADYPQSTHIKNKVQVPVHIRSAVEYKTMMRRGGWEQIEAEELILDSEAGSRNRGHDRALLLIAQRTAVASLKRGLADGNYGVTADRQSEQQSDPSAVLR